MTERFDAIVIGGGVMGSAAARQLASRGRHTLLLERFRFGHANGSSGGPTRIFRLTYHDPVYVRAARAAIHAWRELEDAAGEPLMIPTAGIDVGAGGQSSREALEAAGETFAYLSSAEVSERWPALRFADDATIFVQEDGGVAMAERTVLAQARLARALGADVREETRVAVVNPRADGVDVHRTDGGSFRAPVAVVTAGPWATGLLATAGIDLPLVPSFEQVTYFELDTPSPLPTVVDWHHDAVQVPYLVPDPTLPGHFKIALHLSGPPIDADERTFDPDPDRVARAEAYAAAHLSDFHATGQTDTCLYTNTPDEDFVIDRVGPVVIGSPCSGHGFKFAPLIGQVLAELAVGEPPSIPLEAFRADRAALRSPWAPLP